MRKLEEAASLQQQQHLCSVEASRELLESMEVELSVTEKGSNDTTGKFVQKEEKLDESERGIVRLRKEREYNVWKWTRK